jgi:hypothetical protein
MSTRDDEDFEREVQAHLDIEAERLADDGLSHAEATRAARRAFGNVLRVREDFHERHHWMLLEQLAKDIRYGWRGLWRSRTFAATTVLTLSVGLALITVVFALFNAYVLRPFSVRDPYHLYEIGWRAQDASGRTFTWDEYAALRDRTDLFDGTIAEATRAMSVDGRRITVAFVSGNYFPTLGTWIRIGRAFDDADAGAGYRPSGGEPVAVVSEQAWTRLFDRDPAVLGRTVTLHGQTFVIVGVLDGAFSGLDDTPRDVWVPLTMYPAATDLPLFDVDGPRSLGVVARLRSDVTVDQARSALTRFMARVAPQQLFPLRAASLIGSLLGTIALALSVSGLYGLVTYALSQRTREIGIRMALGATGAAVLRLVLWESARLLIVGASAGLAIAFAIMSVLRSIVVLQNVSFLDAGAFGGALAVVVSAGAVAAFFPARRAARIEPALTLRAEG